jgi:hypothetical protein
MTLLRSILTMALAAAALSACATRPDTRSAYSDGVAAYRIKDYATARLEWRKEVSAGNLSAMNNLGYLLAEGLGGERDEIVAIQLWTTAAKQGHSEAAFHLGRAYEEGSGVNKSDVEAYAWLTCAVASARAASRTDDFEANILQDANDALSMLMAVFPPEHFGAAQELAGRYVQAYARK